jgi:thiamine biosynthesis lipoprotein
MKNIVFVCICVLLAGCQDNRLYKDTRLALGTYIEVISPDKRAAKIVFDEISRIENLLSKYKPDSEVSRLNKIGKVKVSPETFYVIKKAKEFCKLSDGAFDITVAPLMDIWGFTDKQYRVPNEQEIKDALKLTGSDKIILHEEDNVIEFSVPGMKIDLGGIAKGYAMDCAVRKLKENNITSCLISAGQVYALGDKFGAPWKIAIKNARGDDFSGYMELKDKSVATSGDYEQYFTQGNKRYSHIMDPRTGSPADSGITSVTVIAQDALTADALSTAIFVLGKIDGEKLTDKISGVTTKIF